MRRIRLVNFHNLVDETIEIREGGHLFLLGDNGSGKTTVLDAIHLALTGALGMELNAAARIAGGRDGGRTHQGIVLRYDAERGVVNEGGAIAYAVLELRDDDDQAILCAGVGMEATTMDADITRWAILRRGTLEELPLVDETPAGRVPVPRDALREKIGKADLFARMSDYRRALGERLFGGNERYEEVCRFWAMAKAYREIVAGARDFAGLFSRLLPAPDAEVFGDILRSLQTIGELVTALEQLDQQREYVAALQGLVDAIRAHREAIARYRWLSTHRLLATRLAERSALEVRLDDVRQHVARAETERESARVRVVEAGDALRAVQAKDPDDLAGSLRRAESQHERHSADFAMRALDLREDDEALERAREAVRRAARERRIVHARVVGVARKLLDEARTLTSPMSALVATVEADERWAEEEERRIKNDDGRPGPMPELSNAAMDEARRLYDSADEARRQCDAQLLRDEERARSLGGELAALEARFEEIPRVPWFSTAQSALLADGIAARALFELLEPKPSAADHELAALEALLGDDVIASFFVDEGERDRARAIIATHEGARVVVRAAEDAPPPAWVRDLFVARVPPFVIAALGTLLAHPSSLGDVGGPNALGDLEHRGAALRAVLTRPRLLGVDARRRAHEARLGEARKSVAVAAQIVERARLAQGEAVRRHDVAARLLAAFGELRGRGMLDAHAAVEAAQVAVGHRETARERTARHHREAAARCDESAQLVEALRARAGAAGLEQVQRELAGLRAAEERARDDERSVGDRCARLHAKVEQLRSTLEAATADSAHLETELASRASALRLELGEPSMTDVALEQYVRVIQRGDQFKSVEAIDDRRREVERLESNDCAELSGDGSRGVRNIAWAGRFGFMWSAPDLRLEDRRGEPIANVLAQIDRAISEQRGVVNERTRELMDRLVMGELARMLQEQVERLNRTVREMNALLETLRFGSTRYQFRVTPRPERKELVALVQRLSVVDETSRAPFRAFIDERIEELKRADQDGGVPELLDYRRWFDYRLAMRSTGEGDVELTRELRALGSGGEQGVPNYLLVLALAKLMFDNADARIRPLFFDEAFYGIDAGRRDQLLRFATELGLQLIVASPDQDGVTPSVRRTTTLFLVKDPNGDIHLAPYHYWNDVHIGQRSLVDARPDEPSPAEAVCVVGATPEAPQASDA